MNKITRFFAFIILFTVGQKGFSQDKNFQIYLSFGQSNMEGAAKIEPQDTLNIDKRFQVLEAVNCPEIGREMGKWYIAKPPLCRCKTGLTLTDYFGRTMVENLPKKVKVGIINVAVGGCKIELFEIGRASCRERVF